MWRGSQYMWISTFTVHERAHTMFSNKMQINDKIEQQRFLA